VPTGQEPPRRIRESDKASDSKKVAEILQTLLDSSEDYMTVRNYVLAPGSDTCDTELFDLAVGRCIAWSCAKTVDSYESVFFKRALSPDQATRFVTMIKKMSTTSKQWKRIKDASVAQTPRLFLCLKGYSHVILTRYLFNQIRCKLYSCRTALLSHGETPLGHIAKQIPGPETNKVVNVYKLGDVSKICAGVKWETARNIDIFVTVVSILQEILDHKVPMPLLSIAMTSI
jgi:hypothetical protein